MVDRINMSNRKCSAFLNDLRLFSILLLSRNDGKFPVQNLFPCSFDFFLLRSNRASRVDLSDNSDSLTRHND